MIDRFIIALKQIWRYGARIPADVVQREIFFLKRNMRKVRYAIDSCDSGYSDDDWCGRCEDLRKKILRQEVVLANLESKLLK